MFNFKCYIIKALVFVQKSLNLPYKSIMGIFHLFVCVGKQCTLAWSAFGSNFGCFNSARGVCL